MSVIAAAVDLAIAGVVEGRAGGMDGGKKEGDGGPCCVGGKQHCGETASRWELVGTDGVGGHFKGQEEERVSEHRQTRDAAEHQLAFPTTLTYSTGIFTVQTLVCVFFC